MPREDSVPSADYSSIEEMSEIMASSPRKTGVPPPLPGSNTTQAQGEYLNPTYRPCSCHHGKKGTTKKEKVKEAEWWVWILIGLCMVIIIMLLLVLVFTFYENCEEEKCDGPSLTQTNNCSTLAEEGRCGNSPHANFTCADLRIAGVTKSGVYNIYPTPDSPVQVFCDMDTNAGGWTVIQKRIDGSINFFRGWSEYLDGFGSADGEYWLGLDNIHILTHGMEMSLYIQLEDWENDTRYAEYEHFYTNPSHYDYMIMLRVYSGTAGDGMRFYHAKPFATKDHGSACSARTRSAWWFHACYSNLNGVYLKGALNATQVGGVIWSGWHGNKYSLRGATMMLRPTGFVYDLVTCLGQNP